MAELAAQNIEDYFRQLRAMNVQPAHVYPRVTEVVPQIIEFIQGLISKDFAYESGGDVYYRVRKFGAAAYGALSRRSEGPPWKARGSKRDRNGLPGVLPGTSIFNSTGSSAARRSSAPGIASGMPAPIST